MYCEEAESLIKMALTIMAVMMVISLSLAAYSIVKGSLDDQLSEVDATVAHEETEIIDVNDSFEKDIAEIERQQALEEEHKLQEQKEAEAAAREAERVERRENFREAASTVGSYLHKGLNAVGMIACAASIACALAYFVVYFCFARKSLLFFEEGRKYEHLELAARKYGSRCLWSFVAVCISCAIAFL